MNDWIEKETDEYWLGEPPLNFVARRVSEKLWISTFPADYMIMATFEIHYHRSMENAKDFCEKEMNKRRATREELGIFERR